MADDRGGRGMAERRDQPQHVARQVEHAERGEVAVVIGVPAGRAAIAALVRRDDVKPGSGQWRDDLAPGIGQFREAVQQQDERPARCLEPGFEDVQAQAVDPVDKPRPHPVRQHRLIERRQFRHFSPSGTLSPAITGSLQASGNPALGSDRPAISPIGMSNCCHRECVGQIPSEQGIF